MVSGSGFVACSTSCLPSWDHKKSLLLQDLLGWPSKAIQSTNGDLSMVPTDCCRLFTRRRINAAGRISNGNKSPGTTSSNQVTDRGSKVQRV
ncbi:hypothetical protein AVEN_59014-1 [Araneus ventricosus]|uniref:Uncharacterized protein n=1 Tax=Araneus ventricosus TaxID=182803 RepID=A0A4Y2QS55_ARAVE|nr:hypothetical protein AVEN_59014-1 [Araneus ventricosus]